MTPVSAGNRTLRNECSEKDGAFLERVRTIVTLAGGVEKLSRSAGMTSRVIGKYLAGESEPNRTRLIALAKAADVSVAWLAAGEGHMRGGEASSGRSHLSFPTAHEPPPLSGGKSDIDETLLLAILRSIEEVLSKQTTRVSIEKKARLIATLYKMQPALPIERSAVCQMIELIG